MGKLKSFLTYTYHTVCVATTISLMIYCLHKYLQNKDVSTVDYKTFNNDPEDIYPAVTLCFQPQFLDNITTLQNRNINKNEYINFLNGEYWDENLVAIGYDDISTRIEDYFLAAYVVGYYSLEMGWTEYLFNPHNLSVFPPPSNYYITDWNYFNPKYYTSFRSAFEKCFSIDIPNDLEPIYKFEILFNASIFPNGIRPDEEYFGVKVHYPNQYLSEKMRKYSWQVHDGNVSLEMQFKLENLVVVLNRNKPENKCNEDWKESDQRIMKQIMNTIGCQPPYWNQLNYLPNCTNKEQMSKFYYLNLDGHIPPCKIMQKVMYSYKELSEIRYQWLNISNSEDYYYYDYYENNDSLSDSNLKKTNYFKIVIEFDDSTFMEIRHVRAFDIESLIGNSGGYLGLFTGYALMQVPSLINLISKGLKHLFSTAN